MRIILAGCEYSGTTTLAHEINQWLERMTGTKFSIIHDHWNFPNLEGHDPYPPDITDEERRQLMALSPILKESIQRHSIYYHISPKTWKEPDFMVIGLHISDSVYGPLYHGYGHDGAEDDRRLVSPQIEESLLSLAPDVVLVLVKASAEVIAQRMKNDPRWYSHLKEDDIEFVLNRFEEKYNTSSIEHKVTISTDHVTARESLEEFETKIEPHLTDSDRLRIITHRNWK